MNYEFNLDITPGGMPPILHMSQYDTFRTFTANLKQDGGDFTPGLGATAKVKGFNGKVAFEIDCTISGSAVTFQLTAASTDQFGIFPVTIELTIGSNTLSPLCMIFDVQKAGYTNEQAASSPEFENAMEEAAQKYVLGMDEAARAALLNLLQHVAYIDPNGQEYYDILAASLEAKLSYIVADYAQDRTIYTDDSLDVLREGDDLIVTAYFDNGTHVDVEGYTLTGAFTVGTSTITATYGGKSATFDVTVTQGIPSGYTKYDYIERYNTNPDTSVQAATAAQILLKKYTDMNALSCEFKYKALNGYRAGRCLFGGRPTTGTASSYAFYAGTLYDQSAGTIDDENALGYHLHGANSVPTPTATKGAIHTVKVTNPAASPSTIQVDDQTPVSVPWVNSNTINAAMCLLTNPAGEGGSGYLSALVQQGYIKFFAQNGDLVGFYKVAVRDSDNVIGMYDVVEQAFHTSSTASHSTIGNSNQKYKVGRWS